MMPRPAPPPPQSDGEVSDEFDSEPEDYENNLQVLEATSLKSPPSIPYESKQEHDSGDEEEYMIVDKAPQNNVKNLPNGTLNQPIASSMQRPPPQLSGRAVPSLPSSNGREPAMPLKPPPRSNQAGRPLPKPALPVQNSDDEEQYLDPTSKNYQDEEDYMSPSQESNRGPSLPLPQRNGPTNRRPIKPPSPEPEEEYIEPADISMQGNRFRNLPPAVPVNPRTLTGGRGTGRIGPLPPPPTEPDEYEACEEPPKPANRSQPLNSKTPFGGKGSGASRNGPAPLPPQSNDVEPCEYELTNTPVKPLYNSRNAPLAPAVPLPGRRGSEPRTLPQPPADETVYEACDEQPVAPRRPFSNNAIATPPSKSTPSFGGKLDKTRAPPAPPPSDEPIEYEAFDDEPQNTKRNLLNTPPSKSTTLTRGPPGVPTSRAPGAMPFLSMSTLRTNVPVPAPHDDEPEAYEILPEESGRAQVATEEVYEDPNVSSPPPPPPIPTLSNKMRLPPPVVSGGEEEYETPSEGSVPLRQNSFQNQKTPPKGAMGGISINTAAIRTVQLRPTASSAFKSTGDPSLPSANTKEQQPALLSSLRKTPNVTPLITKQPANKEEPPIDPANLTFAERKKLMEQSKSINGSLQSTSVSRSESISSMHSNKSGSFDDCSKSSSEAESGGSGGTFKQVPTLPPSRDQKRLPFAPKDSLNAVSSFPSRSVPQAAHSTLNAKRPKSPVNPPESIVMPSTKINYSQNSIKQPETFQAISTQPRKDVRADGVSSRRLLPPTPADDTEEIKQQNWYFGPTSRQIMTDKVKALNRNGSFAVRDSSGQNGAPYTLVVYFNGKVWNLQVRKRPDNFYALGTEKQDERTFASVVEMINHYKVNEVTLAGDNGGNTRLTDSPRKI